MSKNKLPHKTDKRKTKADITNAVINFFNRNSTESFSHKHIAEKLGFKKPAEKQLISNILYDLLEDAFIIETARGKYKSNNRGIFLEGTFERRSNGKNFFTADGDDENSHIFVAERNSAHAMNRDRVKVQMLAKRKGREPEAEVVEILERKQTSFVGTLDVQKQFAFLVMDSKILANDIFIPKEKLKGGKDGDKALVEIIEWPQRAKNPIGKVVEILGQTGDTNTRMNTTLWEF